jgi:hypothetical protein
MATTVDILIVGLCSFLNMHDKVSYMPPPSVILHRPPAMIKMHTPYIAWKDTETTLENAGGYPVQKTTNGTKFLVLDGEELTLNDDHSGLPKIDATFDNNVASIMKFGNLQATPVFNQKLVPLKGNLPDSSKVAAYVEFGHGTISSDWQTEKQYIFRDSGGVAVDATPRNYDRRVLYTYQADPALVILARKFDGSARRRLVFTPTTGTTVIVWLGNSVNIDEDMLQKPPITTTTGDHFAAFYDTLAVMPTVLIPVLNGAAPSTQPAGGLGTGYCGPDNQP